MGQVLGTIGRFLSAVESKFAGLTRQKIGLSNSTELPIVHVCPGSEEATVSFVNKNVGLNQEIRVNLANTVEYIKTLISELLNIPGHSLIIIHNNTILDDNRPLVYYELVDGSILNVHI